MEQYIPKSAVVAEIERRILILQKNPYENHKTICHLDSLKQSYNTLEVKEIGVDIGSPDGDNGVKTIWDGDKKVSNKAQKGEPVSEDLEEAAKHYLYSNILYDDVYVGNPTDKDCIEMFKAGANWQKQQDKQWLAEEHKNIFAKGRDSMKEQMMKDTVTAEVRTVEDFMGTTTFRCVCDKYKVGDKVKLIIIKED